MRRDARSYVVKDYGAGYFWDFSLNVDINWTAWSGHVAFLGVCGLSNNSVTYPDMVTNNEGLFVHIFSDTGQGKVNLKVQDISEGTSDYIQWSALPGARYLTIERSGAVATVKIYTDAARTTLEDTLQIACNARTYSKILGIFSHEDINYGSSVISATISNLEFDAVLFLADVSLDLSAYYQSLEDLSASLRAHDGIEYRDLEAALEAAGWNLSYEDIWDSDSEWSSHSAWGFIHPDYYYDFASLLSAYFQKFGDMKAFLEACGFSFDDMQTWLAAYGQSLSSFAAALQAGAETSRDLAVFLYATDGIITEDFAGFFVVTDGTVETDLGLYLRVIAGIPAFRSITAQRVSSVIHEV